MKIVFLLFFILNTTHAYDSEKWNRLKQLNSEEIKVLKEIDEKDDTLMFRLFELYSERTRLDHEYDNFNFINKKKNKGKKVNRRSSFKQTQKSYSAALKLGREVNKKYKKSPYKGRIYYQMGVNSRDYAFDKQSEKYFKLALKYSYNDLLLRDQVTLGLAELYYNQKKYNKSKTHFQKVIVNKDDPWLSKNLYNYAWCLFKLGNTNGAFETLKQAYAKSVDPHFINNADQVLESFSMFSIYNDSLASAIRFIFDNTKNPMALGVELLESTVEIGSKKQVLQLISLLQKKISTSSKEYPAFLMAQVKGFDKHRFINKYIALIKKEKSKLKLANQDELLHSIKSNLSKSQGKLKKTLDKNKYNKKFYNRLTDFYAFLKYFDEKKKHEYDYYFGELNYALKEYETAMKLHYDSVEQYLTLSKEDKANEKDFSKKSLGTIFSSLTKAKNSKNYTKYSDYSLSTYLKLWPKEKSSGQIYKNYLNFLFSSKDYEKYEKVLSTFVTSLNDIKSQKKYYKNLVNHYFKKKNSLKLATFLNTLNIGYLSFKKSEIKIVEEQLSKLLFDDVSNDMENSQHVGAINKLKKIMGNKLFDRKIKSYGSFSLIIALSKVSDKAGVIRWIKEHQGHSTEKEHKSRKPQIVSIIDQFILDRKLGDASIVGEEIISNYCADGQNNATVKKIIDLKIAQNKAPDFKSMKVKFDDCTTKFSWEDELVKLSNSHYMMGDYNLIEKLFVENKDSFYTNPKLQSIYLNILDDSLIHEDQQWISKSIDKLAEINCVECIKKVLAFKELENFMKQSKETKKLFSSLSLDDSESLQLNLDEGVQRIKSLLSEFAKVKDYNFDYPVVVGLSTLSKTLSDVSASLKTLSDTKLDAGKEEELRVVKMKLKALSTTFYSKGHSFKVKLGIFVQREGAFLSNSSLLEHILEDKKDAKLFGETRSTAYNGHHWGY